MSEPDYKRETLQTAEERSGETVAQLEARIAALESTLQTILETVADLIDVLKRMNGGG